MRRKNFIVLDAFTKKPFAGNPCAVLLDSDNINSEQMQIIAREINLSETAFVLSSDKADFRVRYFTPRKEIDFAGHPTIATSFLIALEERVSLEEPVTTITLEFNIGVLPVDIHVEDGVPVLAVMTQQVPVFDKQYPADEVAPCFNLEEIDLRSDCPVQVVSTGVPFLIVPAQDLGILKNVQMDREKLSSLLLDANVDAAFMFCTGGFSKKADTHARLLDPNSSFEDPYTGSAAGAMGAYVVHYRLNPGPKLIAEQGHFIERPGTGVLEITSDSNRITSVRLGGTAVKVIEGVIYLR